MPTKKDRHILGLVVEDEPGVLERVSGLLARRGFNIGTIVVGKAQKESRSHIIISLDANDKTIEQIEKQVNKLVDVLKISRLEEKKSVVREHCLMKISSGAKSREDLINLVKLHKAKVLDVNHESIIVEVVGKPEKIDNFVELMKKHGIKEMSRTGVNALQRG